MSKSEKRRERRSKKKQPTTAFAVSNEKLPRLPIGGLTEERPSWRFGHCDNEGPFAWRWDSFHEHFVKLMDMEGKKWPDIIHTGTVGAKRIPLANLDPEATRRLQKIEFDDADALWELRVGGRPRFWGVRLGNCFHFLWWDPDHLVCPSKKK